MKINIVVDCTPDEARRFMGLPDVAPMHERIVTALEKRLVEAIAATDTATLVEQWMPLTLKGIEHWQSLWGQLAGAAMGAAAPAAAGKGPRRRGPPAG
jgi:hypothetical protein